MEIAYPGLRKRGASSSRTSIKGPCIPCPCGKCSSSPDSSGLSHKETLSKALHGVSLLLFGKARHFVEL